MITFRQKEFIAPIIAALAPAVIQGGAGIIQGKKANESQERIARQQQVQAIKDRKAQEQQAKQETQLQNNQLKAAQKQQNQLIKLAKKNPEAAAAVKPTITVGQPQEQSKTFSKVGAVLGGAANLGIGALNSGAVTTAMSMKMNKDQLKSNEKIAAQENANRALETKARVQESNNTTSIKMQELKNQKNEFNKSYKLARKKFSAVKEGAGFVKNLGTLAKERGLHNALAGALVTGTISGIGSYAVDKAIQKDIKKNKVLKIEVPEETAKEKKERKKKRNRKIAASVLAGAALGGGTIAAKKGKFGKDAQEIASKINKENIKSKIKSGGRTVIDTTKDYFAPYDQKKGKRRPNYLGLAIGGASLASPALMYAQKKKAINEQIKQSENQEEEEEKTYSKKGGLNINLNKLRDMGENAYFQRGGKGRKSYGGGALDIPNRAMSFGKLLKKKTTKSKTKFKTGWKELKKHPGEAILGKISSLTGGGGRNGVARFADDLEALGEKTGNKTSQKVGKFMRNNPEVALGGSVVLGGLAIRKARNKAYGAGSKAMDKLDPNAYAYAKYGAQVVPQDRKEKEKEDE